MVIKKSSRTSEVFERMNHHHSEKKFSIFWIFFVVLFFYPAPIPGKKYEGLTLNLLTRSDPIYTACQIQTTGFFEETGATVNIIQKPFDDILPEFFSDLKDGSPFYDLAVIAPGWISDLLNCDSCPPENLVLLQELTNYVKNDSNIDWPDIVYFFRSFSSSYNNNIFSMPLDGDMHYAYYRKDVLQKFNLTVPRTWEEWLVVAATVNGTDFNGDDIPDYGSCIAYGGDQGMYFAWTAVLAFLQTQGTSQGAFFDTNTMEPMIDNPAYRYAMDIYKETMKYGPPDILSLYLTDIRDLMSEGRCALNLDWGDIPGIMNKTAFRDYVITTHTPGTVQVLNRDTGLLQPCDSDLCPFMDTNQITYAPYSAFGGWTGVVSKFLPETRKQAAYDYLSYMSSPQESNKMVTKGLGFDIYRSSQLDNTSLWLYEAKFSEVIVPEMLAGVRSSLDSQNIVIDLRLPGAKDYFGRAFPYLIDYLADNLTLDDYISNVIDEWNDLTDSLGRLKQLQIYRQTIGLPPIPSQLDLLQPHFVDYTSPIGIIFIILASISLVVLIAISILVHYHKLQPVIQKSSYTFLQLMLFGLGLAIISMYFYVGDPTKFSCVARAWFILIGFMLAYGSIIAKNWRLVRIFSLARRLKVANISNVMLVQYMLIIIIPEIIILLAWLFLDPTVPVIVIDGSSKNKYCKSNSSAWIGIALIEPLILVVAGSVLAYKTRKLPSDFRETYYMSIATYLSSLVAILVPVAIFNPYPESLSIISCLGILFGCGGILVPMFVMKLYIIYYDNGKDTHNTSSTSNKMTSSKVSVQNIGDSTGGGGTEMDTSFKDLQTKYNELKVKYAELETKYKEIVKNVQDL